MTYLASTKNLLIFAIAWSAVAVYPGLSESIKLAGVAVMAAALALRANFTLSAGMAGALIASAVLAVVAGAWALEPAVALIGSVHRAQGSLLCLALLILAAAAASLDRADRECVYRCVAVLGAVVASYALVQRLGWDPIVWVDWVEKRPAATLSNATTLAGWILLVLPITLLCARQGRVWQALALLQAAALLSTGSRSAVLALLAVGAAIYLWRSRRWRLGLLALGLLGVLTISLASLRPASLQDRAYLWQIASIALTAPPELIDLNGQTDQRAAIRPWLGYGPDQQAPVLAAARADVPAREGTQTWAADRAHQGVLDTLLETGIVGLCVALWLIFVVGQTLHRAQQSAEATALAVALGAWLLHQQASFALTGDRSLAWLWIGCAVALAPTGRPWSLPIGKAGLALRCVAAGLLLTAGLAAGACLPATWLERLAPALSAERSYIAGQHLYLQALGGVSAHGMREAARAFEHASALRPYDRDAALAAASAWIEAAATEADAQSLQRARWWMDRLDAMAQNDPRTEPIRARIRAVQGS